MCVRSANDQDVTLDRSVLERVSDWLYTNKMLFPSLTLCEVLGPSKPI